MENSKITLRFAAGSSNKYYKVFVREEEDGTWSAIAHYGRVGSSPAVNFFAMHLEDRATAVVKAQEQISTKIRKGYKITKGALI